MPLAPPRRRLLRLRRRRLRGRQGCRLRRPRSRLECGCCGAGAADPPGAAGSAGAAPKPPAGELPKAPGLPAPGAPAWPMPGESMPLMEPRPAVGSPASGSPKKVFDGGLVLADGDDGEVVLAGDGVGVALAEEADVVGVFELVERAGVAAELAVVELDGADVLVAAVDGFDFLFAAEVAGEARGGDGEQDEDERDQRRWLRAEGSRLRVARCCSDEGRLRAVRACRAAWGALVGAAEGSACCCWAGLQPGWSWRRR